MSGITYGREKAVRFGTSASLVGVLTEAAPGTGHEDRPAVLLLNSGILHRVGSCRLHVQVARALSAAGFHTLRFDYSGIGDSDQRRDSLPFEESAIIETREAMDYLAKAKGVKRCVLMGLCSGADMAHDTARVDDRVVGLNLLDAWAYKSAGFYVHHYGPKLLRWRVWQNSIRIRLAMLRGKSETASGRAPGGEGIEYEVPKYVRVFPPKARIEADLRAFVARNMRMSFIWTGGLPEYNHRGQYVASFRSVPLSKLMHEDHYVDADHILTGLDHQRQFTQHTVEWMTAHWPAQTRTSNPTSETTPDGTPSTPVTPATQVA